MLQHAYNPVNWFPWGDEAFETAKCENKPIFLSIGYSTCHWCHVMERESFEDEEVAELLNRDFVSIKVDREERPDIDHLYMGFCQALTGQGGWPLTVIMTPEKQPFFAGTYFPKRQKYGRYGLMELLPQIAGKWEKERERVLESSAKIVEEVQKRSHASNGGEADRKIVQTAFAIYSQTFDSNYGGFGSAPKFPTPHNLSFLLRYYRQTGTRHALDMVERTLTAMYRGGMYDHVGKGFSRYSTDEKWLVPHFEKMLYDNALLAVAYTEACQVTDNPFYRRVAEEIFAYVLRDMTDADGGFYSAEDADSEGVEGKFYVWTPDEVTAILGAEDGTFFCDCYDIKDEGNFEGHSIPNRLTFPPERYADTEADEIEKRLEPLRERLFAAREGRVHPHKDDKILTSWNGLMIAALAKGAKAFGNDSYAEAAKRSFAFIWERLRRERDGRLLARYRDGEAAIPGYIDDYAFLLWGALELYEATFDLVYLRNAIALCDEMLDLFWDEEEGGFFFYGHDSEALLTRMKEIYDGAVPSGNAMAYYNLLRLGRLTSNQRYTEAAEHTAQAFGGTVEQYPAGYSVFLMGEMLRHHPSQEIVIAGKRESADTQEMVRAAQQRFLPFAMLVLCSPEQAEERDRLIPSAAGKGPVNGRAAAYVCENFSCQAPVTGAASFLEQMNRLQQS